MIVLGNLLLALAAAPPTGDLPALVRAERSRIETGELGGGFVERDGARIYFRTWTAPGRAAAPRAVVVVVHGIGFEAGPYAKVAGALGARGIEVRALDLRGHGLSDGRRGLLAPLGDLAADVEAVVERARVERPGAPVFLLGESLGGLVAAAAAAQGAPLDGLILESPAFSAHPSQIVGAPLAFAAIAGLLAPDAPTIPIADSFIEAATRDPDFVTLRRTDPLAQNRIAPRYLIRYGIDAPLYPRLARRIEMPLLVLIAGRDVIVRTSAVRAFVAAAPSADETLIEYHDARHTLLWDPVTPRVLADIGDWILERTR